MNLDQWKNYRKVWSKARDDNKISKGAVSGVSMGDLIDGVAKAYAKGLNPLRAALAKLLAGIKKYKTGIASKKSKLTTWIDANLEKEAKDLDADCVATLKAYEVGETIRPFEDKLAACKGSGHFNSQNQYATEKNLVWLDLVKADLAFIGTVAQGYKTVAQAIKTAKAKIQVEIPVGPKKPTEIFQWATESATRTEGTLTMLSKAKSCAEYLDIIRAKGPELPHPRGPQECSDAIRRVLKEQAGG